MSRDGWKMVDSEVRTGFPYVMKWGLAITALLVVFSALAYGLGWCGEAAQVAKDEFGPRAAMRKYEWFKSAAAQLDQKRANIQVFQKRLDNMKRDFKDTPRSQWPRSEREQYNLWEQEVAGLIASYNGLAAEYNAQMAKWNWRFANKGQLPRGATEPLPREFKPYMVE